MKRLLSVWSIFCTLVLSIAFTACGGTSSGPVGSTATPQSSTKSYTNDLWAIGDSAQQQLSPKHTLVEHWDGNQWRVVTSPGPGTKENILSAAAVIATNDVWAVGYFNDGQEKTLAEHWDGSQWSVMTTPNPTGFANSVLGGVAVVAPNDVWAVGHTAVNENSPKHTLVEHWDGSQWSIVTSPSPGTKENILSSITVNSTKDIWAVGYFNDGQEKTLAEHWDGSQWSVVTTPNPTGFASSVLSGGAVVAPNDVWAVGHTAVSENSPKHTLVEHWDGSQWSVMSSPSPGAQENLLSALSINSTRDIWAVGYFNDGQEKTLAEHWDGSQWSVMTTPNPTGFANSILKSVQVISAKDMWAVGDTSTNENSPKHTLVEHWDGSQWSVVSSPSPEAGESVLLGIGRLPAA